MDEVAAADPGSAKSAQPGRRFAGAVRVLLSEAEPAVIWRLVAAVLLTVSGSLLAGLAPLALKEMIDAMSNPQKGVALQRPLGFAAAYLLALCSGRLLSEWRAALVSAAEQHLHARLRARFFRHLLALPMSFHLERQSGALTQCLHQAIAGYQVVVANLIGSVAPTAVEMATIAVVLATLGQASLVMAFAVTALAYLAALSWRRSAIQHSSRAVSGASIDTYGILSDSLLNIEAIKCFNADKAARDRFENANEVLEQHWATLRRARLHMGMTMTATFALSIAASLAVALDAVFHGTLTVGGFVLANVYMLQVARPLEALGAASRDLSQAMAFISPFLKVLHEPAERVHPHATHPKARPPSDPGPCRDAKRPPAVTLDDVRFAYAGGRTVLDGIHLDIAPARSIAIVGASGSGKSSLIRLLLRLYEPQAGRIRLNGVGIDSLAVNDVRSQFALVSQDTVLFNASIAFNIGIGKRGASRREIARVAYQAGLHRLIGSLPERYDTVVGDRGLRLSGGERQRIAIARALLNDAPILLLDEATSMLDGMTERAILRGLRETARGRTTVTIAHRLSTIQDADEIVVLDAGQVVERGDHSTLLASDGTYAAMWRAQRGIEREVDAGAP